MLTFTSLHFLTEYKKVKSDIKKRSAEAQRWQKKAKKIRGGLGSGSGSVVGLSASNDSRNFSPASQEILRAADAAQLDLNTRLALLQETEKQALCSALVEARSRVCLFVACLKPVMVRSGRIVQLDRRQPPISDQLHLV